MASGGHIGCELEAVALPLPQGGAFMLHAFIHAHCGWLGNKYLRVPACSTCTGTYARRRKHQLV